MSSRPRERRGVGTWPWYMLMIGGATFAAFPLLWVVESSFKNQIQVQSYPPQLLHFTPTLENYRAIFGTSDFIHAAFVSTVVTLASTVLSIAVAIPCAYAIVRLRVPGRVLLILLLTLIQVLPEVVLVVPLYTIVTAVNLYDTLIALIIIYAALTVPFATWVLVAFFKAVPREFEEAALVDGASRIRALLQIVLPLSRPALATTALFSAIGAWNEFLMPAVLGQSSARPLSVFVAQYVTQQKILWGPLTASMVVVFLPIAFIVVVLQRHLVSGLAMGNLKQ